MEALSRYPDLSALSDQWSELGARLGAERCVLGASVEGRPLEALTVGRGRPVLLTSLIHGDELIGGLALLETMRTVARSYRSILDRLRLVVMPVVNPDGVALTFHRLRGGCRVGQRRNARGVDLNRNFRVVADRRFVHPMAGSRVCKLPHYMGPRAFSEPETRAVRRLVRRYRPILSVGFHSFGNLVLYPWAFTRLPIAHAHEYRRLGAAFAGAQERPYRVSQSCSLYPTLGDLDDWLEADMGIRSVTIEVSRPDRSLLRSFGFMRPIRWMNPTNMSGALENVVPGMIAMLEAAPISP